MSVGADSRDPDTGVLEIIERMLNKAGYLPEKYQPHKNSSLQKYARCCGFYIRSIFGDKLFCGIYSNFPDVIWFNIECEAYANYDYNKAKSAIISSQTNYCISDIDHRMKRKGSISVLLEMDAKFHTWNSVKKENEILNFIKTSAQIIQQFKKPVDNS